jgi:hypothetical protein
VCSSVSYFVLLFELSSRIKDAGCCGCWWAWKFLPRLVFEDSEPDVPFAGKEKDTFSGSYGYKS